MGRFGVTRHEKASELNVKGTAVRVFKIDGEDFVCLTNMAKLKSDDADPLKLGRHFVAADT